MNSYLESIFSTVFPNSTAKEEKEKYRFSSSDYLVFVIALISVFPVGFLVGKFIIEYSCLLIVLTISGCMLLIGVYFLFVIHTLKKDYEHTKNSRNWLIDFKNMYK